VGRLRIAMGCSCCVICSSSSSQNVNRTETPDVFVHQQAKQHKAARQPRKSPAAADHAHLAVNWPRHRAKLSVSSISTVRTSSADTCTESVKRSPWNATSTCVVVVEVGSRGSAVARLSLCC